MPPSERLGNPVRCGKVQAVRGVAAVSASSPSMPMSTTVPATRLCARNYCDADNYRNRDGQGR